jgi:hypothetical protein
MTDVRKYGETVLTEARKPWFAAVGAGELAYGQLQTQLSALPAEVQARLRKLQALDAREAVENATATGLKAYGTYTTQARETYESLAHRGELVVRRLRRSPEVKSAFDKVEEIVADADDAVTKPGPTTTKAPAARKAPARKAPAKKTTS